MSADSGRPADEPAEFKDSKPADFTAADAAILGAHALEMPDAARRLCASRRHEFRRQFALGGGRKDPAVTSTGPG